MFEKKMSFGKFAWTFGAGLVAGAVAGLLFAPMTGKRLQKSVLNKVEDFQKRVVNA